MNKNSKSKTATQKCHLKVLAKGSKMLAESMAKGQIEVVKLKNIQLKTSLNKIEAKMSKKLKQNKLKATKR